MHDMKTAASYLCGRYEETYDQKIDEMKLHKLMYFAQRESLIQRDEPLFEAEFQGWRFGPVLPALREVYKANDFAPLEELELGADQAVLDAVFDEYAETDSWNLSLLSHGEICWKRSRNWRAEDGRYIPRADRFLDEKHYLEIPKGTVPMGATGHLGKAELEAIERLMNGK